MQVANAGEVHLGRQRTRAAGRGLGETPYLRVANVLDGHIDFSDVLEMRFTARELEVFSLRPGDVLLNEGQSIDLVGRSAIYRGPPGRFCFQNSLVRFRCNDTTVPGFARAVFKHWLDTGRFMQVARQTTSMAHLGGDRFASMRFPRPPVPEQRRIAEILDAADEAIRGTEGVIAKLRMKRAALHVLLVPVDAAGPKWRASHLGDLVLGAEYGISCALSDEGAVPVLRMMNLKGGGIDLSDLKYSSSAEARALLLRPGDILFNRTNSMEHVGRTSIWRGEHPSASFASYCVRFVAKARTILPAYLVHYMNLPAAQNRIKRLATPAVQQVNVNPTQLQARFTVAFPTDIAAQQRAVDVLDAAAFRVGAEEAYLAKLKLQKQGLMQDLLTGRVRVKA